MFFCFDNGKELKNKGEKMKALIQRVKRASVEIDGEIVGKIDRGLCILLGVGRGDSEIQGDWLAKKVCNLRIFSDEQGKMNLSVKDVEGALLIVSQFTLYGDSARGNRPSFTGAAEPEKGERLYEYFLKACKNEGLRVEKGRFGADMAVSLINDGPVTLMVERE